jgi:hypothetical protein
MTTNDILSEIMSRPKASHAALIYQSFPTPAAEFKTHTLQKITSGVVRIGAEYQNLAPVREAIEAGEREPVKEAPKGRRWVSYPYILESIKDPSQTYLQVAYATGGAIQKPSTEYFIDGTLTTKEAFEAMLIPSARSDAKKDAPLVFSIKTENILGIKIEGEYQMV